MYMMDGHTLDRLQHILSANTYDFSAKYLASRDLLGTVRQRPETAGVDTIRVLEQAFKDPLITTQKQSYFLLKEIADCLCALMIPPRKSGIVDDAFGVLKRVLRFQTGTPHRAAAEALASLPLRIDGPEGMKEDVHVLPMVPWDDLLKKAGIEEGRRTAFIGRSLITARDKEERLLVVKFARPEDTPRSLAQEPLWMDFLRRWDRPLPTGFLIPQPVRILGHCVFRLKNIPIRPPEGVRIHATRFAVGFMASKGYFIYPNESRPHRRLGPAAFQEVMTKNARLMGWLTASGIVHSAPIPLFHNRVQSHRRSDQGAYVWQRAGRLDRWLDSCRYPNFGVTGIRDFEHLRPFRGSGGALYPHIGTQLLSLLLVAASYFRNNDSGRRGYDDEGKPVDARDLFDRSLFEELIANLFVAFYDGFTGGRPTETLPLDLKTLSKRMIEEMGVDRHMVEVLRVADQEDMSLAEFHCFLRDRNYPVNKIAETKKGEHDLTLCTGPHLGAFNERISVPELIQSLETVSAFCIAGKYLSNGPSR
jgi:hypothetical protein